METLPVLFNGFVRHGNTGVTVSRRILRAHMRILQSAGSNTVSSEVKEDKSMRSNLKCWSESQNLGYIYPISGLHSSSLRSKLHLCPRTKNLREQY